MVRYLIFVLLTIIFLFFPFLTFTLRENYLEHSCIWKIQFFRLTKWRNEVLKSLHRVVCINLCICELYKEQSLFCDLPSSIWIQSEAALKSLSSNHYFSLQTNYCLQDTEESYRQCWRGKTKGVRVIIIFSGDVWRQCTRYLVW